MDFDIQVANYSDILCQTFNDANNIPNVVISGPLGTDLINLIDCFDHECNVIRIENGKAEGARYNESFYQFSIFISFHFLAML